jgi:hypothetical protein
MVVSSGLSNSLDSDADLRRRSFVHSNNGKFNALLEPELTE